MKAFFSRVFSEIAALKFTPWYRWHPQVALRYLPVVEWIKQESKVKSQKSKVTILEVGSGGLGITPYLKQPVTGLDIEFEPPIHPLLRPIKDDATKMKFNNNSFDLVISLDMLEHLPPGKREKAISEMLRVARKFLIIGAPCGKAAQAQDQQLRSRFRNKHQSDFPFLKEQLEYGLPDKTELLQYIKVASSRLKKRVVVKTQGNLNLSLRYFLMTGWISNNLVLNLIFRKLFLLLIPLFRLINRPPYYRWLFFVNIKQ